MFLEVIKLYDFRVNSFIGECIIALVNSIKNIFRVNNCIGEFNQKYFIQFLFYTGKFGVLRSRRVL